MTYTLLDVRPSKFNSSPPRVMQDTLGDIPVSRHHCAISNLLRIHLWRYINTAVAVPASEGVGAGGPASSRKQRSGQQDKDVL